MTTTTEKLIKEKIPCGESGIEVRHTICDICSPSVHCGVDCFVKDGAILKIEGTKGFPANDGALCPKGAVGREYAYRKDRIKTPMKRVGEKGSGDFVPISWDEAFKITAEKLNESKKAYGPEATAFVCGYTKWFRTFFQRLAYSFGSPNYLTESSTCYQSSTIANFTTWGCTSIPDFMNTKLLVLWGSDPFTKNIHNGIKLFKTKEKGAKIIVIDPRRNRVSEKLADVHLRVRLGSDGYLALAAANYIISEGLYDKEYTRKYVHGFEEYKEFVKDYSIEGAAKECGLSEEDIISLARDFALTDPSVIMLGNGVANRTNGFNTNRAILALCAICGRFDRPGTLKPNFGATFCYSNGGFASREKEFINSRKPSVPAIGYDRFPLFVDRINQGQAMELGRQILTGKPYPVKTAFFAGVNTMMYPDTEAFVKAVSTLDFLAASDIFWTDACKMADIVFPACTSYERREIKCYAGKFMFYTQQAIPARFDSKSDADIFSGLANALDLDDELLRSGYDACARFILEESSGIEDWEEFKNCPHPIPAPNAIPYKWGSYLDKGLNTVTGKIEIYSEEIRTYDRAQMDPLPVYYPNACNADPDIYDMTMCSGARNYAMIHSRLHKCTWARSLKPLASVDINPEDALAKGINEGDSVIISTPINKIHTVAHISLTTNIGELQMYHGYEEANINLLVDDNLLDPYVGFPAFRQFRCKIEKEEK